MGMQITTRLNNTYTGMMMLDRKTGLLREKGQHAFHRHQMVWAEPHRSLHRMSCTGWLLPFPDSWFRALVPDCEGDRPNRRGAGSGETVHPHQHFRRLQTRVEIGRHFKPISPGVVENEVIPFPDLIQLSLPGKGVGLCRYFRQWNRIGGDRLDC